MDKEIRERIAGLKKVAQGEASIIFDVAWGAFWAEVRKHFPDVPKQFTGIADLPSEAIPTQREFERTGVELIRLWMEAHGLKG